MTHRDQIESAIREWCGRHCAELPRHLLSPQTEAEFAIANQPQARARQKFKSCLHNAMVTAMVGTANSI